MPMSRWADFYRRLSRYVRKVDVSRRGWNSDLSRCANVGAPGDRGMNTSASSHGFAGTTSKQSSRGRQDHLDASRTDSPGLSCRRLTGCQRKATPTSARHCAKSRASWGVETASRLPPRRGTQRRGATATVRIQDQCKEPGTAWLAPNRPSIPSTTHSRNAIGSAHRHRPHVDGACPCPSATR